MNRPRYHIDFVYIQNTNIIEKQWVVVDGDNKKNDILSRHHFSTPEDALSFCRYLNYYEE